MQKCIVVSTPGAKFSALAFKENFQDSIAKVAGLGFDAVELAVRNPGEIDIPGVKNILKKYNLPVPAIGTGQAFGEDGLSFTDPDPEIRKRAVQRIKDQLDFAIELGNAQVIIGLIRGIAGNNMEKEKAEEFFIEAMCESADYRPEVTLAVEPINRYETDLYNTLESTRRIIDCIERDNIKILADTFHMNIEEPDIFDSIRASKKYISHIHVADSNRWAPGCGHIDFTRLISTLKEINYDGAVSAEILPEPTPEKSAELTMEHYLGLGL